MREFKTIDGLNTVRRISRWITIKQAYNITKRNHLWDYATDENGYYPYQDEFDSSNGVWLDYFRFGGRTYAINQFYTLGSIVYGGAPYEFIDTDGKSTFIVAVDDNYWNPLYIELEDGGERVRVYEVD